MRRVLPILLLIPLAACTGGSLTTEEQSYPVDGAVTALVVDARAAAVTVRTGAGPATVTETFRYAGDRPRTAHAMAGGTLTLTETGCRNDDVRCNVAYDIVVPATATAHIKAQAGAVKVTGLSGDITVQTEAGAVEGRALTADRVTVSSGAGGDRKSAR